VSLCVSTPATTEVSRPVVVVVMMVECLPDGGHAGRRSLSRFLC